MICQNMPNNISFMTICSAIPYRKIYNFNKLEGKVTKYQLSLSKYKETFILKKYIFLYNLKIGEHKYHYG